ncbi:hypothetical protein [Thalassolituus sp.]|uniref:hypothetical protein n=1 Tax=Thalassolituus sp. TaxID=2030822 RepID=UPI003514516E
MAATPLNEYLVYLPSRDGRQVYIDPSLVPVFTECVNPTNDAGRKIANDIHHKLSSDATGTQSGQAIGDAAEFYMDIGNIGERCVRVFYRIVQAESAQASKGPGVYVHNIQRVLSNGRNVDVGLFHMKPLDRRWIEEPVRSSELTTKVLRLGSMADQSGLIQLNDLANNMLKASGQDSYKTDFNLYHCPLSVSDAGNEYSTPQVRQRVISPSDLAEVLVKTASLGEWSGRQYDAYTVYCYADASKLLEGALAIAKQKNISLEKFSFSIVAPYSPYSFIDKLARDCGATSKLERGFMSSASQLHQNFDPASINESAISTCKTYSDQLETSSDISFFELWKGMGSAAHLPNVG